MQLASAPGHVTALLLEAALALHEAGCCVVPARPDGSKAPAVEWRRFQAELPPEEQLEAWLAGDAFDGFGIVCGTVSAGLEMLEFEGRAVTGKLHIAYRDLLAGHGLGELWAQIINGYTELTPGGGLHILYRVRGVPRGNTKLARNAGGDVLIETRGEGGFTIVAPSGGRTHASGRSWQIAAGGPATIVTISEEDRDALHAIANMLDEQSPAPAVPARPPGAEPDHDRPGDDYNARATWDEILGAHGWRCIRSFGDDARGWRRPGKETPGISATTRERGGLYVFSTSTPFDIETPYSKFGAYAVLNHGGDYSAAAAQLARDGYGMPGLHPDHDIGSLVGQPASADPFPEPAPAEISDDLVALASMAALYTPVNWHRAFTDQPEDIAWLFGEFLERGTVNALFAKPGTGKSLIALEIALAVIRDGGSVVYVDDENRITDLVERLRSFGIEAADELDGLHMYSFAGLPPLDTTQGGMHLLALAVTRHADLVVLDTTTRMVQGRENDSDTFLQLYRCSLVPLKARGITVLRLDHPGKDAERGQRGSSAKDGDVDTIWRLAAMEGGTEYQLERTKSRSGHGEHAFMLTRQNDPLRHIWAPGSSVPVPFDVQEIIDSLNVLDVPLGTGREKAQAALKAMGWGRRNDLVQRAVNIRNDLSGTGRGQRDSGEGSDLSPVPTPKGGQGDRSDSPAPDCSFGTSGTNCLKPGCKNPDHGTQL